MNVNSSQEKEKIVRFIRDTLQKTKIQNVVLGLSGGIDSATSLYLLKQSIPKENIIVAHLHYFEPLNLEVLTNDLPKENVLNISIKEIVDTCVNQLSIRHSGLPRIRSPRDTRDTLDTHDTLRFGNIAARVRMIILYDLAKKYNALVCGTENKSEHLLGYFTRFGDEASDFEPIMHLYKTQVYELAKYLNVPNEIINIQPTAGLWPGQTDEKELGFTYFEADQILHLYFDKKLTLEEIKKKGFPNTQKIISRVKSNEYKHHVPYSIES